MREHRDGVNGQQMLFMKSGKVAEHPPGKVGLSLRLVLDMDQK